MPVSARRAQLLQHVSQSTKAGGKVTVPGYSPAQVVAPVSAPATQPPVVQAPVLSEEEQKLIDFEEAMAEAEAEVAQDVSPAPSTIPVPNAVPATILAATPDPLNPQGVGTTVRKEVVPEQVAAPVPPVEIPSQLDQQQVVPESSPQENADHGVQVVEHEPAPEISPEVSEYLKEVQTHQELQPHEVVIANQTPQVLPAKMLPKPVIVLPITPDVEDVGKKKNVVWSIRWLVEWSQKIMKMFSGKVIYKEVKAEV